MSLSARNKKDALVCLAAGSATAFLSFIYFINSYIAIIG